MPPAPRPAWAAWAPYLLVSAFHLGCQLLGAETAGNWSKTLLMPALALVLLRALSTAKPAAQTAAQAAAQDRSARGSWLVPAAAALFFSWLGDLALLGSGELWFLGGVAMFLVAQLSWITTFRRAGRRQLPRWLAVPYVAWWFGLVGFFVAVDGVQPILLAVGLYGLALGTMAYLAHRVSPMTAIGAASFLVSDSLIGLSGFAGVDLPGHGFWVMSTYLLGQGLIVAGLLAATDEEEPVRSSA